MFLVKVKSLLPSTELGNMLALSCSFFIHGRKFIWSNPARNSSCSMLPLSPGCFQGLQSDLAHLGADRQSVLKQGVQELLLQGAKQTFGARCCCFQPAIFRADAWLMALQKELRILPEGAVLVESEQL